MCASSQAIVNLLREKVIVYSKQKTGGSVKDKVNLEKYYGKP